MLDRTTAPEARGISKVNFAKAKSIFLSNGLPVHIIDAGQHDIIRLEITLKSGKWYEKSNGLAYFTSQMLLEGTSKMSSKELADIFEYNGAHVSIDSGIDYNIITVYVISSKLVKIIGIIKDCVLNSIFPEEELIVIKDIQRQQLRINNEKNSYVAGREIRKLLFGKDHPYGKSLELDQIDDKLNRQQLDLYYQQYLLRDVEIIISGRMTDEIVETIKCFDDIPIIASNKISHVITDSKNSEVVINKKESLQSSIRLGKQVISKTHGDFTGLIILNEIFGGFFGSRLMMNIREDKGYTYGIHSSLVSHLHGGFWVIGTDVKKEFVDDTIDQIYFEADRLREDLVGVDELKVVKNYLLGNFLSSLETSFALADKFKNIYFFGQDYSFYNDYVDTINVITPKEIQDLAIKYLDKFEFKRVVVG